jgi:outer membrane receptor protein involved in Fe transport
MMKSPGFNLFIICLFLATLSIGSLAQTTGKIAGHIEDASTSEPLVGVNVFIKGMTLGASTDQSGDFYIINVPPGVYTVEAQIIGYKTVEYENLRVSVNRTAGLNLQMESTILEGEVITVQADKVAIKKDQTSSIRNISSEEIELLPVENIERVVAMQPGIVGNHFRGGRSNEAVYMIDGIKVTESFLNESMAVEVNPSAAEDIEVITGTFNAEYGDAMSGVVNVITKEGGAELKASVTGYLGNYFTAHGDKFIGLSNSEFDRTKDLKFTLGGPLLFKNLSFLIDGRYNEELGYLNGIHYFNIDDYSDYTAQNAEDWITEHTGSGAYVSLDWLKQNLLFGKLTYKPLDVMKLSLSVTVNDRESQNYIHAYKYNPYGLPTLFNESYMYSFQVNHMLSSSAFYEIKLAYSDYQFGNYLYEDPTDSRYVHDEYSRSNGFITGGQSKNHTIRSETTINGQLDISWQLNKNHFFKAGIMAQQIELSQNYSFIRNRYEGTASEYAFEIDPVTNERVYTHYDPVIFPDSSAYSDIYSHKPIKFAVYLQDKIEHDKMVVNIGVRLDYFYPDAVVPTNYRNPANQLHQIEESRYTKYKDADPQYQFSPRLGLAYKLGESALLRFSYGHFLQLPPLLYYYQNNAFLVTSPDFSSSMGNANLKPQKTIKYEVGLWQQLTDKMNFEIAVYYSDIYDLVTATIYTTYDQIRYGVFSNLDYGNTRGLEMKYQYRTGNFSAGFSYTLGYTRGVADNPQMSFNRAGQSMDPVNKMIPMAWDQRHVFNTDLGYNTKDFGFTFVFWYRSGETYTWNPLSYSPLARINLFPNNQHKPPQSSLDLRAYLNFLTIGDVNFQLSLLAYNLLDHLNEEYVDPNTGRADQVVIRDIDLISHKSVYHEYEDQVQNPAAFLHPRLIKMGLVVWF